MTDVMSGEQDWRLKARLDPAVGAGGVGGLEGAGGMSVALDHLLGRLRGGLRGGSDGGGPNVVHEVQAAVPHDVVLTHDGRLLFAYAADQEMNHRGPRCAFEERAQPTTKIKASIYISHWDDELDAWRQIDPPSSGSERVREEAAVRDAETVETRTLVASSGKMIRAEFEQSMLVWGEESSASNATISRASASAHDTGRLHRHRSKM